MCDKSVIKIYTELSKLKRIKNNPIFKKGARDLNRHFTEEKIRMRTKLIKIRSTSFVTREMKDRNKTTIHLLEWLTLKRLTIPSVGKRVEELESYMLLVRM